MRASRLLPAILLSLVLATPALAKQLDDEKALDLAERITQDEDPADAKKALDELRALGDDGIWDMLEAAKSAEDDDADTIAQAIAELGKDAIPELVLTLAEEDDDVRSCAASALEEIGKDALPALVEAVRKGPTEQRRFLAAQLISKIGTDAIAALIAIVKDGAKEAREAAGVALVQIGEPCVKPLVAILPGAQSGAREVTRAVLYAVGSRTPEAGKTVFKETLALLKSKNPDLRRIAALTVGKFGGAEAMPAVLDGLCSGDEGLRKTATECAGYVGAPAVPDLVHSLGAEDDKVADAATEALSTIGAPAAPALQKVIKHPTAQVRGCAICALGNMKHRASFPLILPALDDQEEGVRDDAKDALASIAGEKLETKAAAQAWWEKHKDDPEPKADAPKADGKKDAAAKN